MLDLKFISGVVKTLFSGAPLICNFAITDTCNASCAFCSFPTKGSGKFVSLHEGKAAIDHLANLGVKIISFTGGEPTLHPHLFDLIKHATDKGLLAYTGSNGILIDEEKAQKYRAAKVTAVWLSVESTNARELEKNRGVINLTEKIKNALKQLQTNNVNTFAISVINKNILSYQLLIDFLFDLGFNKVKFDYPISQPLKSSYLGFGDNHSLFLEADEAQKAVTEILHLKKIRYRNFKIINAPAGLRGFQNHILGEPPTFPCYAGKRILYLDWNLDLFHCNMLPKKYGHLLHVKRQQLEQIACNRCYYQGCRDYDSLFYLFHSLSFKQLVNPLFFKAVQSNFAWLRSGLV